MLLKLTKSIPNINDSTTHNELIVNEFVAINGNSYLREDVSRYLNNLSMANKKLTSVAIVKHLKDNNVDQDTIDYFGVIARDTRVEDTIMRTKRDATVDEKENYMSWEDILELREDYNNKIKTGTAKSRDEMKYVALCLFTMIPPQRGQVFYNCYIDREVPTANILKLDTKELIVREYKTKRLYGTKSIKLPQELVDVLTVWKPKCINNILLPNNKFKPMDTSTFTSFMYSIFKQNISTDMLRKIYVSYRIKKGITMEERKVLAEEMGHSVLVQEFNYVKKFE